MKTKNHERVLTKADGIEVCAFCLKELKVDYHKEYDSWNRDYEEWNEYECTCSEWNNELKFHEELEKIKNNYENFRKEKQKELKQVLNSEQENIEREVDKIKEKYNIKKYTNLFGTFEGVFN